MTHSTMKAVDTADAGEFLDDHAPQVPALAPERIPENPVERTGEPLPQRQPVRPCTAASAKPPMTLPARKITARPKRYKFM